MNSSSFCKCRRPFLWAVLVGAALLSFSQASLPDRILLKTGEQLEGRLVAENETEVLFSVEVMRGIFEEREIERSEIDEMVVVPEDDRAVAEIERLLPTPDLLDVESYDTLIDGPVAGFIQEYPDSRHRARVEEVARVLGEEREKLAAGGLKFEGEWITPQEYERDKFWIDGEIVLLRFEQMVRQGRRVDALRQFEEIEALYSGTDVFARALETAKPLLRRYRSELAEVLRVEEEREQRERERMASMTHEQRRAIQDAQREAERAFQERLRDVRRDSRTKWLPVNREILRSLQDALRVVENEIERLEQVDADEMLAQGSLLREVDDLLREGRIQEARETLDGDYQKISSIPYARELQTRVRNEEIRLREEERQAEMERRERERQEMEEQRQREIEERQEAEEAARREAEERIARDREGEQEREITDEGFPVVLVVAAALVVLLLIILVAPKLRKEE